MYCCCYCHCSSCLSFHNFFIDAIFSSVLFKSALPVPECPLYLRLLHLYQGQPLCSLCLYLICAFCLYLLFLWLDICSICIYYTCARVIFRFFLISLFSVISLFISFLIISLNQMYLRKVRPINPASCLL